MNEKEQVEVLQDFLSFSPYSSDPIFEKFLTLEGAHCEGDYPERFLFIPGVRSNKVVLVAHADTYWTDEGDNPVPEAPARQILDHDGNLYASAGHLGADDRAGCAILWLLRDLGHSILITDGEEIGRIGSYFLANNFPQILAQINQEHLFFIQFDRRNANDFKVYNVGTPGFVNYVSLVTPFIHIGDGGSTDITVLSQTICGVNLSIGYQNEHTENEYLNVDAWLNTLDICKTWLSQDQLPRFTLP